MTRVCCFTKNPRILVGEGEPGAHGGARTVLGTVVARCDVAENNKAVKYGI